MRRDGQLTSHYDMDEMPAPASGVGVTFHE